MRVTYSSKMQIPTLVLDKYIIKDHEITGQETKPYLFFFMCIHFQFVHVFFRNLYRNIFKSQIIAVEIMEGLDKIRVFTSTCLLPQS